MNRHKMSDVSDSLSTLDALRARLDRVEAASQATAKSARRWRRAALAIGAIAVAFGAMAATQSARTPDVIRARRFEVVDQHDKIVLLAGIGQNGGQIDVWGAGGTNVVRVSANTDGGDIVVWNGKGQAVGAMYATSAGGRVEASMPEGAAILRAEGAAPSVVLADGDSRPRFVATVAGDAAGVSVRHSAGHELVALGASPGSGGIVRVAEPDGTLAAQMLAYDFGGVIECASRTGGRAAMFGCNSPDTGGSLSLFAPDGNETLSAQARTDAGARLSLLGDQSQPVAVIESGATNAGLISLVSSGKRLVGLGTSAQGGLLNLCGPEGRALVAIGAASDADGGALSVLSGTGGQLVRLGVDRLGGGEVAVYDGPGTRKRVLNATAAQP